MVVEKSIKNLENSQALLTIKVDAQSIADAYQKKLAKYQKDILMDGFRKGKAPLSLIERKYGDMIYEESTFEELEKHLHEVIETLQDNEKPLAYSTPVLQDEEKLLPFKKGEDLTFSVTYDVYPSIAVENYKGRDVEVSGYEISDEDVQKEIDKLLDQNAIVKTKDGSVAKNDIVTVDYVEIDGDGNEVESTKRSGFTFTVGSGYNLYKLDDDIVGMNKGEEKTIEKKYAEDDTAFPNESKKIKVKIDEVKVKELPALDDEFAQDVKEEYKTVEDLKKGTKEKLEKDAEEYLKSDKVEALLAILEKETKFDLPKSMVEVELESSWKRFVRQSGLDEEVFEKFMKMQDQTKESIIESWRPDAEKNVRQQLILEEIKKKEDFPVDEEEFKKACDERLKNIQDESSLEYYKGMIKDEMQFAKVVPFLLENNNFITKEKKSYKEFMERV